MDTGVRVRVAKIDAPEIEQPFGLEARDRLCTIIYGRYVDIEPQGTSYDRVVGLIWVGGINTSEATVRAGAAWDYARYDCDPAIPGLEQTARAEQLGLWGDLSPVAPWDWRHSRAGRFTPQL